jgi:hypothetical protein
MGDEIQNKEIRGGFTLTKFYWGDLPQTLENIFSQTNFEGLQLVTEPVHWAGPSGDEERLKSKYENEMNEYGILAWKEITKRLSSYYSVGELDKGLEEIKNLHRDLRQMEQALPANRKTYYHQAGEWEKANGHVDQYGKTSDRSFRIRRYKQSII